MEERANPSSHMLARSHRCPRAPFVLTTDSSGGRRARRAGAPRSQFPEATSRPGRPALSRQPKACTAETRPSPLLGAPTRPGSQAPPTLLGAKLSLLPPALETQPSTERAAAFMDCDPGAGLHARVRGHALSKRPARLSAGWECGRKKSRGVPGESPGLQGRE